MEIEKINLFSTFLVTMSVVVFLFMVNKQSSTNPLNSSEGKCVLKMPRIYSYLGYFSVLISVCLLLFLGLSDLQPDDVLNIWLTIAIFLSPGLPLIIMSKNYKIEYDQMGVTEITWLGQNKHLNWIDVNKVNYSNMAQTLYLHGNNTKVSIHSYLVGYSDILDLMDEKLDKSLISR